MAMPFSPSLNNFLKFFDKKPLRAAFFCAYPPNFATVLKNDKIVRRIAEYRWRYMLYAFICWGVLILGFVRKGFQSESLQFWLTQGLFFIMAAWLTWLLLSGGSRFIGRSGASFDLGLSEEAAVLASEDGVFRFHDKGFSFLANPKAPVFIPWQQITGISAWVEDNLNGDDQICLRIDYTDSHFIEFEEDTPGYLKFVSRASSFFPVLNGDWQAQILTVPGRTLKLH